MVAGGCSDAVVGAQLWWLRSTAAGKAEYGNDVDSPSPDNGRCWSFTGRGTILPKIEDRGDLNNDETKQSRVLEDERNQYQFAKVAFRGGDGDGHFTATLVR